MNTLDLDGAAFRDMIKAAGPLGAGGLPAAIALLQSQVSVPDAVISPTVSLTAIPTAGIGVSYGDTFSLHSNPTSPYKVYLDFDGFTTTGTEWNNYWGTASFFSSAFSLTDGTPDFSSTELTAIQQIWQYVSEAFAAFNIDVTTQDPGVAGLTYSGVAGDTFGTRVVITDEAGKNYGGIAYIGSFDWTSDTPAYVYSDRLSDNPFYIGGAIAHEVGHTLGLLHDGVTGSEYYYGHGTGATDWAPIMGASYYSNIFQWSAGQYTGATQTQDDLAIITSQNSGVSYVADDYGNTRATASQFAGTLSGSTFNVQTYGVISGSGAQNDTDCFVFDVAAGGSLNLQIGAVSRIYVNGVVSYDASPFTSLDVAAWLFDQNGVQVGVWNDPARLDATISLSNLTGGRYYLMLDGVGTGDPYAATPTGYTEYGSLGQYMISGSYTTGTTIQQPQQPQPPALLVSLASGTGTTSETGGTTSYTVKLTGATSATGSVSFSVGGVDGTEGILSGGVILNEQNNWTSVITVAGVNDRDDDGNVAYQLNFTTDLYGQQQVTVINADNDITPTSIGARSGAYKAAPTVTGTMAGLAIDGGEVVAIKEGTCQERRLRDGRLAMDVLQSHRRRLQAAPRRDIRRRDDAVRFLDEWRHELEPVPDRSCHLGRSHPHRRREQLDGAVDGRRPSGDTTKSTFSIDLLTLEKIVPAGASFIDSVQHADWLI